MRSNTILKVKPDVDSLIAQQFEDFIVSQNHPCVMAQSVFKAKNYVLTCYDDFGSSATAGKIIDDMSQFIDNHEFDSNHIESFLAVFPQSRPSTEQEFEDLLWQQLSEINKMDEREWDPEVGSNPEKQDFSFSIAGRAFFIIGMHPNSSRKARRSPYTALVFNLHHQFDRLRERGVFNDIKQKIRKRDIELQGNINPMAKDFGKGSEAKQYSGRAVDDHWECPFKHSKKE